MATSDLKNIKLGDRVVYADGTAEHNAIALDSPHEGHNQGIKLKSLFLSLIYLDDLGVPVKHIACPLLAVAADEEHLKGVALDAAERDVEWPRGEAVQKLGSTEVAKRKSDLVAEHLSHVKANPRTIGWRPYIDGEELARTKAKLDETEKALAQSKRDVNSLRQTVRDQKAVIEKLAAPKGQ